MSATPGTRLGEDARFELAAAAGAKERRNRPAWMVAAAGLVLAGVLLLALLGVSVQAQARADLRRTMEDQAAAEQMIEQFRQLSAARSDPGLTNVGEPMAGLRTRLEELARQGGFETPPFTPNEAVKDLPNGLKMRTLNYYNVKAKSLGIILEWLRLATQDAGTRIPGLEVESLGLKPDTRDGSWSMNLGLRRWERAG